MSSQWWPVSDWAIQFLRTRDVLSSNSPQLGPWSRWGWSHPGPAIFFVLAPFVEVFGARGMLIGALSVNWAACLGSVYLMKKAFGNLVAVVTALLILILMLSVGPLFLMSAWNPSLAFFPFFFLLILMWRMVQGQYQLLPIVGLVSTFCVQSHIGFALIVGGVLITGLVLIVNSLRREADFITAWIKLRFPLLLTIVSTVLLWLPPLIEELRNQPGNIGRLLRYARHPSEAQVGWSRAVEIMGNQLEIWGPWSGRIEVNSIGEVASRSPLQGVLGIVIIIFLIVSARRRSDDATVTGGAIWLVAVFSAFIATSRIAGDPYPYLLRWWWAIPAFAILVLAVAITEQSKVRSKSIVNLLLKLLFVILTSIFSVSSIKASDLEEPYSEAILNLGPQVLEQLSKSETYVVYSRDTRAFGAMGPALVSYLENSGVKVLVPDVSLEIIKFGAHRTTARTNDLNQIEILGYEELSTGVKPSIGFTQIAVWDALTDQERTRLRSLEIDFRSLLETDTFQFPIDKSAAQGKGISVAKIGEFEELISKAFGYVIFLKSNIQ